MFWFWDDRYEQTIKSELIKLDLKEAEQNIAMVAELNTIHPTINMPEGFRIEKASSPEQIKKFGETLANLFWFIRGRYTCTSILQSSCVFRLME